MFRLFLSLGCLGAAPMLAPAVAAAAPGVVTPATPPREEPPEPAPAPLNDSAGPAPAASATTGPAQPSADSGDALGFGAPENTALPPPPPPQHWSVYGTVRSDWALWTERLSGNPFAKGRQSVDLNVRFKKNIFRLVLSGHAEYDFAYLYQRDSFDQPTLDSYEWQLFPREAFAGLTLGRFELTAGYQVVPWGHGELLSPVDIAMPRDQREPGLQEPANLRLPVLSTRLSYFRGGHRVELMMIHLPAFGLRPAPSSSFNSLPALFSTTDATAAGLSSDPLIGRRYNDITPGFNQQLLWRYTYNGPRVDLGVYAGTLLDLRGVFVVSDTQTFLKSDTMDLRHDRFAVLGTSGSAPLRWFLLTWEASCELGRSLNVGQFSTGTLDSERAYLVNTMLGVTFTGVRDLRLSVELLKPWVINDRDDWLQVPDRPVFAARAAYSLFSERLQLSVVASFIGFSLEQGWFLRGEGSFTIRDGLKVSAGYITYQPGTELGPFYGFAQHDRFYAGLRWDFTLL